MIDKYGYLITPANAHFKFKRLLKYLFQRRIAIRPGSYKHNQNVEQKILFQWQKMPPGYRWF